MPHLALRVRCEGISPSHGPVNPICVLLGSEELLLFTEWQQATVAPQFSTVLVIPSEPQEAVLRLQVRHVEDPFWDGLRHGSSTALLAMPLLGECSFTVHDAHGAHQSGLPLLLLGSDGFRATISVAIAMQSEPWGEPERITFHHSCTNYSFLQGGQSTPAAGTTTPISLVHALAEASAAAIPGSPRSPSVSAAAARAQAFASQSSQGLRVSEHAYTCTLGYSVPRAVLRVLTAEARALAAQQPVRGDQGAGADSVDGQAPMFGVSGGAGSHGEDPTQWLACLSTSGWAAHARWLEQSAAQLGGAFQNEHGFKASTMKTSRALAPMPTNLQLNVMDVVEETNAAPPPSRRALSYSSPSPDSTAPEASEPPAAAACRVRAVYHTVSVGCFAAHSLGFQEGGAAELETKLKPPPPSSLSMHQPAAARTSDGQRAAAALAVEAFALSYAQRLSLLSCQACAALAASFIGSCQERIGQGDAAWFAQVRDLGYLVQVESLLTTRGDEWGML